MSEKHWRAILVDPLEQKLEAVFIIKKGDYMPRIKQLLGFTTLHFLYTPGMENVFLVDDEALLKSDANDRGFFQVAFNPSPICGRALLIGLTVPEGDFTDCALPLEQVRPQVAWPKVRFVGLKQELDENAVHPVYGNVTQMTTTAIFEPIADNSSAKTQ